MGNWYSAIRDCTAAIRLKPGHARADLYRAEAYCQENRFERALADLEEAVRLFHAIPKLPPVADGDRRGRCILRSTWVRAAKPARRRNWDKAVDSLSKAIEKLKEALAMPTGDRWGFQQQLGRASQDLALARAERGADRAGRREFHEAVVDLNAALELDPSNAQICRLAGLTCAKIACDYRDRGLVLDEREQWATAARYLKRAVELDPDLEYQLRRALPGRPAQSHYGNPDRATVTYATISTGRRGLGAVRVLGVACVALLFLPHPAVSLGMEEDWCRSPSRRSN